MARLHCPKRAHARASENRSAIIASRQIQRYPDPRSCDARRDQILLMQSTQHRFRKHDNTLPPPVDGGIPVFGPPMCKTDPRLQGLGWCAIYRDCKCSTQHVRIERRSPGTAGLTGPDIHAESSRSLVHESRSPASSAVAIQHAQAQRSDRSNGAPSSALCRFDSGGTRLSNRSPVSRSHISPAAR